MGEMVEYRTGAGSGTANAWLAKPGANANGKGILVLQEMWGLVPHIKDVADRFAKAGYVAVAPDLWDGDTFDTMDDAFRRFLALKIDRADSQLRGAIELLRANGATGKVGAVGFCLGGQLSMYSACEQPDAIGACVNFYGIHPEVHPKFERLKAPILAIFGKRDPYVTTAHANALEKTVTGAGGKISMLHYDADHAFFNDSRLEVYDEGCALDAWKRTLGFFAEHL